MNSIFLSGEAVEVRGVAWQSRVGGIDFRKAVSLFLEAGQVVGCVSFVDEQVAFCRLLTAEIAHFVAHVEVDLEEVDRISFRILGGGKKFVDFPGHVGVKMCHLAGHVFH